MKRRILFVVNVDTAFLSHRLPIGLEALKKNFEVHLATSITNQKDYLESKGFVVHPLGLSRSKLSIVSAFRDTFELVRLFTKLKPDLVHMVTMKPILLGGIAARVCRVPAVLFSVAGLGSLFMSCSLKSRLIRSIAIQIYRISFGHHNLKVIFQNEDDRELMVHATGLKSEQTTLIRGSGVELEKYSVSPLPFNPPLVMFVGRLIRDKGVCEFIDAAKIIKADSSMKGLNPQFELVGDNDMHNPSSLNQSELEAIKCSGVVNFTGFSSDVPSTMRNASIVVLPSYREGFPKVLMEAAASGKPVITTDVPGCRDAVLDEITGLVVPVRDSVLLAHAIKRLLNNPLLCQEMGLRGRDLAEATFNIKFVVHRHMQLYSELLCENNQFG